MATYNTAFGSLPGYNEMLGTTNTTGGGQQQTYGQTTQTTTTQPQQPSQTFAQLQKQGIARPAPPTAQPVAQYGGSQQAQQMRQRLQQQLEAYGQAPSRFDTQAFQQIRGAQAANLQQEYQGQLKALNEELARRGLSASSVGGGRMGDLAGQQARALATLDAQLLQQAAQTQAEDRARLLAEGRGLAELAGAQDLSEFEANRVRQAAQFDQELRGAQFGQQQYEFDIRQALEERLGLGGLGLKAEDVKIERERLAQQKSDAEAERTLRETMQTRELTAQEKQQLTDIESRKALQAEQFKFQKGESEAERDIRLKLQTGQITAEQAQQERQIAAQKELQTIQLAQQAKDAAAERTLRDAMQVRELSSQEKQQLADITSRKDLQTQQLAQQKADAEAERTLREKLQTQQLTSAEKQQLAEINARKELQVNELKIEKRKLAYQEAAQLAEQSGTQYTVDEDNNVVQAKGADGKPIKTSAVSQADLARKQQDDQFKIAQFGTVNPTEGQQTLAALQQQATLKTQAYQQALSLSEQSGQQYTVDENGKVVPLTDKDGNFIATNAAAQANLNRQQDATQFTATNTIQKTEQAYKMALGLSQQSGVQYQVDKDLNVVMAKDANGNPLMTSDASIAKLQREQQNTQFMISQFGVEKPQAGARTIQATSLAFQQAATMSEQSGFQYTVDTNGNIVPLKDAQGNLVRTSDVTQANLDRKLREQLGMMEATGDIYTIDASGNLAKATGTAAGRTLAALQQNLTAAQTLSQITGKQYTVNEKGELVMAGEATKETELARQFNLDKQLRQALGMSEATGYVYDPITGQMTAPKTETVQGQIARSQTLLALAGALGNLTPEQIAQLLGKAPPTTQAGDTTTTRSSGTTTTSLANPKDGDTKTEGGKNYVYRGVWPTGQWVEQTTSITTTTTDIKPTQPTTTTTKATENTTTTTKDPMATTPLLDRQQQQINDVLAGPAFDGRYQYVTGINGWAVYKGGKWYAYNAAPPVQPVVVNGQQTNVYPGWTGIDFSNNVRIMWDGVKFVAL